jgi:hypothetical protein
MPPPPSLSAKATADVALLFLQPLLLGCRCQFYLIVVYYFSIATMEVVIIRKGDNRR